MVLIPSFKYLKCNEQQYQISYLTRITYTTFNLVCATRLCCKNILVAAQSFHLQSLHESKCIQIRMTTLYYPCK